MKEKFVKITKKEYNKLKKLEKVDMELMKSLVKGLEDIKEGKVKPWKS